MTITIINYEDQFAEDAVRMYRASFEQALGIDSLHSFDNHVNWFRNTLASQAVVKLALDIEIKQVVGLLAVKATELDQLYIHVDYQQQGLGSRFMEIAKQLSPDQLELWCFQKNIRARRFYEKHGFIVIGSGDGSDNEEGLPDLRYQWTSA